MHFEAHTFVEWAVSKYGPFERVVEVGGRDINGSVRPLFAGADYLSLDVVDGPGVDVVGDAMTWRPKRKAHAVVCCEVLEHVPDPLGMVDAMGDMLLKGGVLILTAACRPRSPHSAFDGGPVQSGEHYRNVSVSGLEATLTASFRDVHVEAHRDRGDVYAVARK